MGLFDMVKESLPVSGDAYNGDIITQIKAAVLDLTRTTEIRIEGVVSITVDDQTHQVIDNSTIEDELVITAISTWCNMRIGNPPNYDKLHEAYNEIKGSLRLSSHYNGGAERCEC